MIKTSQSTKNILVTGGAGYIGSVLVGELLENEYHVTVLDRFMFGGESLLAYVHNPNLRIVSGDIRNRMLIDKLLNNQACVIHLAALVGEPACRENLDVTKDINLDATIMLAEHAKDKGVSRFIMTSTCSNYGVSTGAEEATETSPLHPLSLYASTKIGAEKAILALKDTEFYPTILRLATIFGLSPKMRFNLMVNEFAREAAIGGKVSVINKDAWRPFLHVKDAARVFLAILQSDEQKISGEIFNVVSENVQKEQLAVLAKGKNPNITVTIQQGRLDDKRDYRVSAKKILQQLAFSPHYSVEDGFIEIMEAVSKGLFLDTNEFRFNAWFDKKVFSDTYAK